MCRNILFHGFLVYIHHHSSILSGLCIASASILQSLSCALNSRSSDRLRSASLGIAFSRNESTNFPVTVCQMRQLAAEDVLYLESGLAKLLPEICSRRKANVCDAQ